MVVSHVGLVDPRDNLDAHGVVAHHLCGGLLLLPVDGGDLGGQQLTIAGDHGGLEQRANKYGMRWPAKSRFFGKGPRRAYRASSAVSDAREGERVAG